MYRGRAFVVDAWYMTGYEPLRNATGEITGMLYVGANEDCGADAAAGAAHASR